MATTQWYSKIQAMAPPSNATMYESKAKTKKKNYRVKDEDIPDHITKPRLSLVEFEEQLTQIRDSEYDDGIDALSGEARKKAEESRLRAKQMFQQHVKRSHEPQEVVLKRRREQVRNILLMNILFLLHSVLSMIISPAILANATQTNKRPNGKSYRRDRPSRNRRILFFLTVNLLKDGML